MKKLSDLKKTNLQKPTPEGLCKYSFYTHVKIKTDENKLMFKFLSQLPERERLIIIHLFGLFGETKKKQYEVGKMLNIGDSIVLRHKRRALDEIRRQEGSNALEKIEQFADLNEEIFGWELKKKVKGSWVEM